MVGCKWWGGGNTNPVQCSLLTLTGCYTYMLMDGDICLFCGASLFSFNFHIYQWPSVIILQTLLLLLAKKYQSFGALSLFIAFYLPMTMPQLHSQLKQLTLQHSEHLQSATTSLGRANFKWQILFSSKLVNIYIISTQIQLHQNTDQADQKH